MHDEVLKWTNPSEEIAGVAKQLNDQSQLEHI